MGFRQIRFLRYDQALMMETMPLTLYGGEDCDDTERVTGRLRAWGIAYREVIIENDPDAERFVRFINSGFRSTPTLVFGEGRLKFVLTEPTDEELAEMLVRAGHHPTRNNP